MAVRGNEVTKVPEECWCPCRWEQQIRPTLQTVAVEKKCDQLMLPFKLPEWGGPGLNITLIWQK